MQIKFEIWIKAWDESTGEITKCVSENSFMEVSDADALENVKVGLIGSCTAMEEIIKNL